MSVPLRSSSWLPFSLSTLVVWVVRIIIASVGASFFVWLRNGHGPARVRDPVVSWRVLRLFLRVGYCEGMIDSSFFYVDLMSAFLWGINVGVDLLAYTGLVIPGAMKRKLLFLFLHHFEYKLQTCPLIPKYTRENKSKAKDELRHNHVQGSTSGDRASTLFFLFPPPYLLILRQAHIVAETGLELTLQSRLSSNSSYLPVWVSQVLGLHMWAQLTQCSYSDIPSIMFKC